MVNDEMMRTRTLIRPQRAGSQVDMEKKPALYTAASLYGHSAQLAPSQNYVSACIESKRIRKIAVHGRATLGGMDRRTSHQLCYQP